MAVGSTLRWRHSQDVC